MELWYIVELIINSSELFLNGFYYDYILQNTKIKWSKKNKKKKKQNKELRTVTVQF